MRKLLLIAVFVFSMSFVSCDVLWDILLGNEESKNPAYGNFWATNFKTNEDYRVDADLVYSGTRCNIYLEKKSNVTSKTVDEMGKLFDQEIYSKMINAFSITNFQYNGKTFKDIMEFADWLSDGNGKLTILLLDIKDNFSVDGSYVAGYFWPVDLYEYEGSNKQNMIYIDTYPGMFDEDMIKEAYGTLAHEMQHMMNFATGVVKRPRSIENLSFAWSMDTWIDEGLSAAAEYIFAGNHSESRIVWFNTNGADEKGNQRGNIDIGNNFFVWGNRNTVLDDYATVYIFFQWLRLHAGGTNIYRDIINSEYYNHNAVIEAFKSAVGKDFSWDELLKTWLAANYINAESGLYGYLNDKTLKEIRVPAPSSISTQVSLFPGEGVYSKMNTAINMPTLGTNIKYASISVSPPLVDNKAEAGRILLSYNTNSFYDPNLQGDAKKGNPENGATTGVPITPKANISAGRSVQPVNQGPYRIGAGDALRQWPFGLERVRDE